MISKLSLSIANVLAVYVTHFMSYKLHAFCLNDSSNPWKVYGPIIANYILSFWSNGALILNVATEFINLALLILLTYLCLV